MEIPLVGSYHTELAAYAGLRSGDPTLEVGGQARGRRLLRAVPAGALAEPLAADEALATPWGSRRAASRAGTAANPRCACGGIMRKKYASPAFSYLAFLRIDEPPAAQAALKEEESCSSLS